MYPCSVQVLHADALFASALQRSDDLNVTQIWRAITGAIDGYGAAGCAARVAQEFGDHPEIAAARMRWARAAVGLLPGQLVPSQPGPSQPVPSQPVPRMRRMPAAESSAFGRNPAAGLSAIMSA
jgi:hypothetical protein